MLVLGIETACDDTGAAVVENGRIVHSNVVWTQKSVHERYGGVVPELAARRHVEVIVDVIEEALAMASVSVDDIDAVGVNCQHGLLRSIVVGVAAAKAIAFARQIPLVGVHHIEGHIYSGILTKPDLEFPHLCLTVSGGHNLLIHVIAPHEYRIIGRTLDDAAGEAFDKVAKEMGLGFPGGAAIDKLASTGNPRAFNFPRPLINDPGFDFSFSGLKTAVHTELAALRQSADSYAPEDLAASFQAAVVEVLVDKVIRAATATNVRTITVVGGVSANQALRAMLLQRAKEHNLEVVFPVLSLCTDNGAMVAALAYHQLLAGRISNLQLGAAANAPLGSLHAVYKQPKPSHDRVSLPTR